MDGECVEDVRGGNASIIRGRHLTVRQHAGLVTRVLATGGRGG